MKPVASEGTVDGVHFSTTASGRKGEYRTRAKEQPCGTIGESGHGSYEQAEPTVSIIASLLCYPDEDGFCERSTSSDNRASKAKLTGPEITHFHCQSGWRELMIRLYSPGLTALGTRSAGLLRSSYQLLPIACAARTGSSSSHPWGGARVRPQSLRPERQARI